MGQYNSTTSWELALKPVNPLSSSPLSNKPPPPFQGKKVNKRSPSPRSPNYSSLINDHDRLYESIKTEKLRVD